MNSFGSFQFSIQIINRFFLVGCPSLNKLSPSLCHLGYDNKTLYLFFLSAFLGEDCSLSNLDTSGSGPSGWSVYLPLNKSTWPFQVGHNHGHHTHPLPYFWTTSSWMGLASVSRISQSSTLFASLCHQPQFVITLILSDASEEASWASSSVLQGSSQALMSFQGRVLK